MLVLQDPPIRTDFTVSNGNSAEPIFLPTMESLFPPPVESVYKRDQSSKTENLRTALSSSEMINTGNLMHIFLRLCSIDREVSRKKRINVSKN